VSLVVNASFGLIKFGMGDFSFVQGLLSMSPGR